MTPTQVSVLIGIVFIAFLISKFANRKKSSTGSNGTPAPRDKSRDLHR